VKPVPEQESAGGLVHCVGSQPGMGPFFVGSRTGGDVAGPKVHGFVESVQFTVLSQGRELHATPPAIGCGAPPAQVTVRDPPVSMWAT
jgi:hypothetical protein